MRRKIAKRLRREILGLGGVIEKEEKLGERGAPSKDRGYSAKIKYNGWSIGAVGKDELEAYRLGLECMKIDCAEPFRGDNGGQRKSD